jgi:gas vesicle protein
VIEFLIGMVLGGIIGVMVVALCVAASREDGT